MLLIPRAYPSRGQGIPVPEEEVAAPALMRQPAFLLLGGAFFLSLLMQTAVPFLLPVWGAAQGFDTHQVALAFVVMGIAGLLGRFILTGQRMRLNLRLWIVAPAALIALAGFVLAIIVSNEVILYAAAALLGFSTSFYGALFAIASLACYPPHQFAKVSGSLLMPIGVGAAVAALLPGLAVDRGVPYWAIWGALAGAVVVTSGLFLAAEVVSPVRRARVAGGRSGGALG
jgi:predicted MFS family arabinose efflux permease